MSLQHNGTEANTNATVLNEREFETAGETAPPPDMRRKPRVDVERIKAVLEDRHLDVLRDVAGISGELLDGRHHPCPRCGGKDRFRLLDESTGAVFCNQCFATDNGDSVAAVRWMRGVGFLDAMRLIGDYLGVGPATADTSHRDIVADVARAKRMPLESFLRFGAAPAKRGKLTVARVPVFDERSERSTYFDLTADGKGWFAKGGGSGVFLPGRTPQAGETWHLVEGCKDAAALDGLGYLALGLPTSHMHQRYAALLRGCHVVLVPDLDTAGQQGAELTAGRLCGVAASVRTARLPGEIRASGGADVRDILATEDGERLLREAIETAASWERPAADGADNERPEVELGLNESRVVAETMRPVGNLGWTLFPRAEHLRTYQRPGGLVHVVGDCSPVADIEIPEGTRRIRPLPASLLRERIGAAVRLYTDVETKDGGIERAYHRPPDWLVKMIHERGEWPRELRPLTAIATAPTLRPDGSIVQATGYDERTGLLLDLAGEWPKVPDRPTKDDAVLAAAELLDVIADFPFAGDAHRSGWLALVLTLVGRPAVAGPVPLFLIDANTRGSGKSLAADAAGIIGTGRTLPRKTWTSDDDEVRKSVTAVALEALPVVLLDNVVGRLGCGSFDAALTGTTWSDRLLGQSKTTGTLPLSTVWAATGNNVELMADTARRTLLLRLESPEEHPEERTGFRHPDLLGWVTTERRRLATAALTILRAYVVAGRPDQGLSPWGSFESWSALVRNAIVWAGLPDPGETRSITREADRSAELLRQLLDAISATGEATAAEFCRLATVPLRPDEQDPYPALRSVVAELCGDKITPARLGARFRGYVGRVCRGRMLIRHTSGGLTIWGVGSAGVSGHGGHSGHAQHSLTREISSENQGYTVVGSEVCVDITTPDQRAASPPSPPCPPSHSASGPCSHPETIVVTAFDGYSHVECAVCQEVLSKPQPPAGVSNGLPNQIANGVTR